MRQLFVIDLGSLPYARAWELQREVARARIAGDIPEDVLLLVEHPPVVTMGRSSKEAHLVASRELLAAQGVELFEVERGGDVTFHGPGQLVGYPIIDLKRHKQDLHWYLRQIEESLIRGIARWGLEGKRVEKYTGVWIDGPRPSALGPRPDDGTGHRASSTESRKLASIGVHARDWVTWHGFALNVATELRYFDLIVPCGIQSVTMTSMSRELAEDRGPTVTAVGDAVGAAMAEVFGLERVQMPLEWLRSAGIGPTGLTVPRAGSGDSGATEKRAYVG